MLSPIEENALRVYLAKVEKDKELMRTLTNKDGFYSEYYKKLTNAKSNKIAFDELNELYFELFGKYRYSDFNTFKRVTNYYNNKPK